MLKQRKGTEMAVKKSSKNSGGVFSWVFAVVVVTVAAIGVGWLIGQQVLNFMNPEGVVKQGIQSADAGDSGYTYYPWDADVASTEPDKTNASPVTTQPEASDTKTSTQTQTQQPKQQNNQDDSSQSLDDKAKEKMSSSSSLFKVRVGSFSNREDAVEVSKELEAQGYPVYVTGSSPYSIQVGAFSSMENAVSLSEQLSDKGYTSSVVK